MRCRDCGRTVEFLELESSGKLMPLEHITAYEVLAVMVEARTPELTDTRLRTIKAVARPTDKVWVGHNAICPNTRGGEGGEAEKGKEAEKAGRAESGENLP